MIPKQQVKLWDLPVGSFYKTSADSLLYKVIRQRLGTTYIKDPRTRARTYPRDADGKIIYHIPTTCSVYKSAYSDNFIRVTKKHSNTIHVIEWQVSPEEAERYEEAVLEFQNELDYGDE